jgi:hypothetical protein
LRRGACPEASRSLAQMQCQPAEVGAFKFQQPERVGVTD